MIERIPDQIPVQTGEWRGTTFDIIPKETFAMACRKINELVDTVNKLYEEAENNARIRANHENLIDTLVEENNVHEKQIDELQMRDEDLAERINYTLAKATGDKEALKLLDEKYKPVDKFAEQRKALKIAVDALGVISQITNQIDVCDTANDALNTVTALEQKDK